MGITKAVACTLCAVIIGAGVSDDTVAAPNWAGPFSTCGISLDNNVAYVVSPNMPAHCSYQRAQIPTIGADQYQKNLFAYVMAQNALKRPLAIVIDSTQTVCVITGAHE